MNELENQEEPLDEFTKEEEEMLRELEKDTEEMTPQKMKKKLKTLLAEVNERKYSRYKMGSKRERRRRSGITLRQLYGIED